MQRLETSSFSPRGALGARVDRGGSILRGQVGWWAGAHNGKLIDLMGRRHGVLGSGAVAAAGQLPMIEFDGGSNGYADLGAAALLHKDDPFTLSWVERVRVAGAYMGLFVFCPSGTSEKFIVLRDDSDTNYRYLTASLANKTLGNVPRWANSSLAMSARVGKEIRCVLIGYAGMGANVGSANFRLIVDIGYEAIATAGGTSLGSFTGATNLIGWDSVDNKFQGAIGCTRLWTRALSVFEAYRVIANPMIGLTAPRGLLHSASVAPATHRMFIAM